jgi:hypothetical protein
MSRTGLFRLLPLLVWAGLSAIATADGIPVQRLELVAPAPGEALVEALLPERSRSRERARRARSQGVVNRCTRPYQNMRNSRPIGACPTAPIKAIASTGSTRTSSASVHSLVCPSARARSRNA